MPEAGDRAVLWSVQVVCTDRGQHPEARIASLFRLHQQLGSDHVDVHWTTTPLEGGRRRLQNKMPDSEWIGPDGRPTYKLACHRCGRNHEIKQARLDSLFATLHNAAVEKVDLSMLRC